MGLPLCWALLWESPRSSPLDSTPYWWCDSQTEIVGIRWLLVFSPRFFGLSSIFNDFSIRFSNFLVLSIYFNFSIFVSFPIYISFLIFSAPPFASSPFLQLPFLNVFQGGNLMMYFFFQITLEFSFKQSGGWWTAVGVEIKFGLEITGENYQYLCSYRKSGKCPRSPMTVAKL